MKISKAQSKQETIKRKKAQQAKQEMEKLALLQAKQN